MTIGSSLNPLLDIPVTHSERLLTSLEQVLRESRCALEDLDG
jgi:hypothetical protein